jgi:hypothetical protein
VFLFVIEGETVLAINYFIPAGRVEDLQIGPLLAGSTWPEYPMRIWKKNDRA